MPCLLTPYTHLHLHVLLYRICCESSRELRACPGWGGDLLVGDTWLGETPLDDTGSRHPTGEYYRYLPQHAHVSVRLFVI